MAAACCRRSRRRTARASASTSTSPARDFGASLSWTVNLEDGSTHAAAHVDRRLSRKSGAEKSRARGSPGGASNCRSICRRDITNCEVKLGGGARQPLLAHRLAARMLRAARDRAGRAPLGRRACSSTRCVRATIGASAISPILQQSDPLAGAARRGLHRRRIRCMRWRRRSPQRAQSLQRIEPAFPQRAVHRRAGGARVQATATRRARAHGRAAVRRAARRAARGARSSTIAASPTPSSRSSSCCIGDFRDRHLTRGSARAERFRAFVRGGGALLKLRMRVFDALDRHFGADAGSAVGLDELARSSFATPTGRRREHFAAEHPQSVEFFLYLQWLAHEQLCAGAGAGARTRHADRPVRRLCGGANPSGSETWVDQTSYRCGAEIGAPPDPLALEGAGLGHSAAGPVRHANRRALRASSG